MLKKCFRFTAMVLLTMASLSAWGEGVTDGESTDQTETGGGNSPKNQDVSGNGEEAICKIGDVTYTSLAEAVAAAQAGNTVTIIKEDTYTIPGIDKNITIKADDEVEVTFNCSGTGSIASIPNGATFEGVTMNFGQTGYHGFQHAGTINMKNCTLNGLFFSYGDMNFIGCTFKQEKAEYMMWDYGQDLTYTDCTFEGHGKFINVYNENNGNWNLTVTGCTFKNNDDAKKAPINIKETCGATLLGWDVTIGEGNKLEGKFPTESVSETLVVGGGGLWQVDDRYSDHTKSLVVVKDAEGKVLYEADKVAKIGEVGYTSLADAVKAACDAEAGETTIQMIADVVLTEGMTINLADSKNLTLDLNGKSISIAATGFDFTKNGTNKALRNGVPQRFAIVVNGNGTLNICDNSTDASGKIETLNHSYGTTKTILVDENATVNLQGGTISSQYAPFYVVGYTDTTPITSPETAPKPSLNVSGGEICGGDYGIAIKGNTASLKVTGGTIKGKAAGISTNGTQDWYDGGKFAIEITGGTITSTGGSAMYLPAEGPTVITGGKFSGTEGISVKGGTLSISGDAVFEATGANGNPGAGTSGATSTGSCIYVEDTYTGHRPIVQISGGKFSSEQNKAVQYYTNKSGDMGKVTVSGGLFGDDSAKDYLAEGKTIIKTTDKETEENPYLYEVVSEAGKVQVAPEVNIEPAEGESGLTEEQTETAVENAVKEMAANSHVDDETLAEGNKKAVNESLTLEKNQSVGIAVEFTGAKVSATTGTDQTTPTITFTQLTFDVTPYIVETVTVEGTGETSKTVSVLKEKIDNDKIKGSMTFRLPIPSQVTGNYARVIHHKKGSTEGSTEEEDMGMKKIEGEDESSKYIEIITGSFSTFDVVFMQIDEPNSLYYYAGSSTKQEKTPTDFLAAQETAKNAIAFVDSEYATWAATQTNVVVEYKVGSGNNTIYYECPDFKLDDEANFYTPVDFVALKGSYTRTNTQGLNSVCLPFEISTSDVNNGKIGVFHSTDMYYVDDKTGQDALKESGKVYFNEVEVGQVVPAGTPCIVECTDTDTGWNITWTTARTIKASVNNEHALKGAYIQETITKFEGKYKVGSDGKKLCVMSDSNSTLYPFRAYLDLNYSSKMGTEEENTGSGVKEFNIAWTDDANAIESVKKDSEDNVLYDLSGRMVKNPAKGGLYIMNGKKMIIK